MATRTFEVIDVLDRVLDKGIHIDGSMRVSCGGIELIGVDAHVDVLSIETYLARELAWSDRVALAVGLPYASGARSARR